jgi:hypothetical protein
MRQHLKGRSRRMEQSRRRLGYHQWAAQRPEEGPVVVISQFKLTLILRYWAKAEYTEKRWAWN